MATQLQVRRGTTSELQSFTGAEGEITVDTDKDTVVVHDGSTAGGHPLVKASQARGFTLREHYIGDGTWTKTGKDGLKRIIVEVFGGGGGGRSGAGGGGGGQGGHGYVILDVSTVTDNVSITVGSGGSGGTPGNTGGTTSFGSYIQATGGAGGDGSSSSGFGGIGGTITGTTQTTSGGKVTGGVVDLGSQDGTNGSYSATAATNYGTVGGTGGGPGGGREERAATGVSGGGGGGGGDFAPDSGHAGADGSVIIYEIYGEV